MSGYGSLKYGSGGYGGSGPTFDLVSVTPVDNETLDLSFSEDVLRSVAAFSLGSYSIPGVQVLGALFVGSDTIRLHTTPHVTGKKYTLHVVGDLRGKQKNLPLTKRVGSYTASIGYPPFVVSDLKARPRCEGNRIHLTWKNPAMTVGITIHRRSRGYPFDLTDEATEVYSGSPIKEFLDTGLEANTFYYYLVVATNNPSYATGVDLVRITKASLAMGLSIEAFNSKDTFFWRQSTRDERLLDALPTSEGGGEGYLERWFTIFGCWLDTLRGWTKALENNTDDDRAPLPVTHARVRSLGTEPEGDSYDYLTPRRMALGLAAQYQIRGSCNGIVDVTKILTLWDATCVDLGNGDACPSGATSLKTYDGVSALRYDSGSTITSSLGEMVDPGGLGVADEWAGGKLLGWIGDVACVEGSTPTKANLNTSPKDLTTTTVLLVGGTTIGVSSVLGLKKGIALELRTATVSHISEVASVDYGAKTCVLVTPSPHNLDAGTTISIGKSSIRAEYYSESGVASTPIGGTTTITDTTAAWEENQWKGHQCCPEGNGKYLITGNSATELFFGVGFAPDGPITYGIAYDYDIGVDFDHRTPHYKYRLSTGYHSTIYNPLLDFQARGTRYDYYNRLYSGPGANLMGAWGPNDVGVFITTPGILVTMGETAGVQSNVFQLDPNMPAPALDEWAGMYLNPNQNQGQLFRIVTNTTTTVTVAGDITSLCVKGQRYYVLGKRDAMRYLRLDKRLRTEFTDTDARPHIFFT